MSVTRAMSIASWAYFVIALLFVAAGAASGRLVDIVLTHGQLISLAVLVLACLALGVWSRFVAVGRARMSYALFTCSFLTVTVLAIFFGTLFHAFLVGIPFMFVAVAWQHLHRERRKGNDG